MKPMEELPESPTKGSPELKRRIPKNHAFDPKSLKPLAKCLYSLVAAHGHALSGYREFSKLKSVSISPDGMLGGDGYVTKVQDIRRKLHDACDFLSSISDSLYDEIHAPHWKPKLADLSENDAEDVKNFVDEAKDIKDDPESFADESAESIERKNDGPGGDDPKKPYRGAKEVSNAPESSMLPGGGDFQHAYTSEVSQKSSPYLKRASRKPLVGVDYFEGSIRVAGSSSSLPVEAMPGGPRVDHIEPGAGMGPFGSFNEDEMPIDDWSSQGGIGTGPNYGDPTGASGLPSDYFKGPSRVIDQGLGDSDNDALEMAPETHHSGVPKNANWAHSIWNRCGCGGVSYKQCACIRCGKTLISTSIDNHRDPVELKDYFPDASALPGDGEDPVARSDYFPGDRGNLRTSQGINPMEDSDLGLPGASERHLDTTNQYIRYEQRIRDFRK